jgi:putative ATP-dependent endonuclease of OLD family
MLFQAFVAANLAEAYAPESMPILALEEPEAHLHPSAIRSLGSFLQSMAGQMLVSSHSGDLVSRVPVMSLRRLYKQNGETKVGRVGNGLFTDRELQVIDYNIRLAKGHYLFSRCWLLVEGESEFHLMPLLFEAMGYSQDQISFSVIEFSQIFEKGESFIKLAKALGIQWFMMTDGDQEGDKYINRANNHLERDENLPDRARKLAHLNIEHEFWHGGYDQFITDMVTTARQKQSDKYDVAKKTKSIIEAAIEQAGGKPAFAQALAKEVQRRGSGTIPQRIQEIITHIVRLTGG